ncbi:MAG: DUF4230 domain-containing protein [Fimbriimonadaceae bacterium]|nr:DUF4230 domain-containing protein [Fimbriimonadaceae bacterium]QYK54924.1 MAG: DUF4230 domain-containing protein [Fimbriimonadaceae bacterium]
MRNDRGPLTLILAAALGAAAVYVFFVAVPAVQTKVVPTPVLLQRVQALGELRTVRHQYEQVFEYGTQRRAADWAAWIPASDDFVGSLTRNKALVTATGTVDAGIDLRKAQIEVVEGTIVVTLPKPRVYEPVVTAKVHTSTSGLLWNDANLGLRAQQEAGARFVQAARSAGVEDEATAEARRVVGSLLTKLTDKKVVVR